MPIPDTEMLHLQVTVRGEFAALGADVVTTDNVFHFRRTSTPATLNQANFVTGLHALIKADWKAACSAQWTWSKTLTRCIDDATDAGSETVVGEVGGVAGECLPAFNCQLINKKTALRGRSYRGRFFIPSVPEGGADGNTLTVAQLALLTTLAGKLDDGFADSDGNTWVPFLFSASLSVIDSNPTLVNGSDITLCTAVDPIAVLRSRKTTY